MSFAYRVGFKNSASIERRGASLPIVVLAGELSAEPTIEPILELTIDRASSRSYC